MKDQPFWRVFFYTLSFELSIVGLIAVYRNNLNHALIIALLNALTLYVYIKLR